MDCQEKGCREVATYWAQQWDSSIRRKYCELHAKKRWTLGNISIWPIPAEGRHAMKVGV